MTKTSVRTITLTEIPADLYHALAALASEEGASISELSIRFLDEGVQRQNDHAFTSSSDTRIYQAYRALQRRLSTMSMLEALARDYQRAPTDEALDQLRQMCDDADFTLDEIMAQALESKPVEASGDVANAKTWLLAYADHRLEVPAAEALADGMALGFKKHHITFARNELGWQSVKRGKGHVWVVKDNVLSAVLGVSSSDQPPSSSTNNT